MPIERLLGSEPRLRDRHGIIRRARPLDEQRWYVIHTKPKQEERVDLNLRHWGLDTLTPRLSPHDWSRPARQSADRWRPLFPGYLFARFDAAALLSKVRLTRGVHSVVGFGEFATPVDDEIIMFIRSRLEPDGSVRLADLQPGEPVEIVDGPMRSLVGVFQREVGDRERVVILLTALGAQTRVNVARALVRKLPA